MSFLFLAWNCPLDLWLELLYVILLGTLFLYSFFVVANNLPKSLPRKIYIRLNILFILLTLIWIYTYFNTANAQLGIGTWSALLSSWWTEEINLIWTERNRCPFPIVDVVKSICILFGIVWLWFYRKLRKNNQWLWFILFVFFSILLSLFQFITISVEVIQYWWDSMWFVIMLIYALILINFCILNYLFYISNTK